jgi:hypothetical protein
MPIVDIQRRFRELGRLRMGRLETTKGKPRPVKLATWRLTTRWRHLLDAAVELGIGGEVVPWEAPDGPQWELITETDRLDVIVPPGDVLSQWLELWSGGGCQRRCDGVTMVIDNGKTSDRPCRCPADPLERLELAKANPPTGCRETTRLVVMLPGLPDLGVWRLESHGFNAAVELGGAAALVELATRQGTLIPAALAIEQRRVKRLNEPVRRFAVPVLSFRGNLGDTLTALGMVDGDRPVAIGAGVRPPIAELPAAGVPATPPADLEPAPTFAQPAPVQATPPVTEEDLGEPEPFVPPSAPTEEEATNQGALPPDRFLAMRARDAGLEDTDRRLTYLALTGKRSGKDLTVAEVNKVAGVLAMIRAGRVKVGVTKSGKFSVWDTGAERAIAGLPSEAVSAELEQGAPAAAPAEEEPAPAVEEETPARTFSSIDEALEYLDTLNDDDPEVATVTAWVQAELGVTPKTTPAPPAEDGDDVPVDGEVVEEPELDLEEPPADEELAEVVEPPAALEEGAPAGNLPNDPGVLRDLLKSHGISISTALRRTGATNLAGIIGNRDALIELVAWLEAGADA